MNIVLVHVKVKKEFIQDFIVATVENAKLSLGEPGIVRFDLLQQKDSPQEFIINEIYKDSTAPLAHKETSHYKKWRESVAGMMEDTRFSVKYENLFPDDDNWQ